MESGVALRYTMLAAHQNAGRLEGRSIVAAKREQIAEPLGFLTPKEVSQVLRVSVYTVRRWIKDGSLPAYKVGRGWRISEPAMSEWLGRNRSAMISNR